MRRTFATVLILGLVVGSSIIVAPAAEATPSTDQAPTPSWTQWVWSTLFDAWDSLVGVSRENQPSPHQAPPDQADGGPEWDPDG